MRTLCTLSATSVLFAACAGSDDEAGEPPPARTATGDSGGSAVAPPPADGGTRAGHAGDATRVVVPDEDGTPPEASISVGEGEPGAEVVGLRQPRLSATAAGADEDSGIVRVRVSLAEIVTCRSSAGGTAQRRRTRYVPEPQVERINARPGTRIATRDRRTVSLPLSLERCPRGSEPVRVRGEVWGEAINGLGLEAVTAHTRVEWRP